MHCSCPLYLSRSGAASLSFLSVPEKAESKKRGFTDTSSYGQSGKYG
ncbi:hypothetical protein PDR5_44560 [Pseudomonas sp. DR 5-09]|nr:hypothetical protein PDR5_44560 [Pseudomonas sp. DR 5-09]